MSDVATPAVAVGAAAGGALPMLKFVFAFIFVIALMLGLAWAVRRAGLAGPILRQGQKRRLAVVETLPVDHRRRLALVRCDGEEHLLLLGPEQAMVVKAGMPALSAVTPPSVEEEAGSAVS